MQRRRFVTQLGAGFISALGMGVASTWQRAQAQTNTLRVQWLGHTCFLFEGSGRRVLVNPFRALGCTAGYRVPTVASEAVLISSRLFDEGGTLEGLPGSPRILAQPGTYELNPLQFQGIATPHDREGGRRFGTNVIWRWRQGGLNIVHMGGAAAPIEIEQQILLGRPDVLLIPVGGGPKAYNAEEAIAAIRTLRPRIIIPTHFRTQAANPEACDIDPIQPFLELMRTTPTQQANGDSVTLSTANLPGGDGMMIQLLTYSFS
ncbi:MAG: MBL fold metallo-hydrolase [Leptolyngbyaceae cyanobacterium T60_A2020_046]|nr:MBL fold metallo-hydrolase [Leptolyngbyaceae cyanobacterium T60_A2020_046]